MTGSVRVRSLSHCEIKIDVRKYMQTIFMGLGALWEKNLDNQDRALRLDRFERIPLKFSRFFGLLHTQMGPKFDFAPGAIRILLCCNQTWELS